MVAGVIVSGWNSCTNIRRPGQDLAAEFLSSMLHTEHPSFRFTFRETSMGRKYAVTHHVDVLVDVVVEAESKAEAFDKVRSAPVENTVLDRLSLPGFVVPTRESPIEEEVVDLDPTAETITIEGITFAVYSD